MGEMSVRWPRSLKVLVGVAILCFVLWLWLDRAFRAADTVPLLLTEDPVQALLTPGTATRSDRSSTSEVSSSAEPESLVDCSTAESTEKGFADKIDRFFGAELIELALSGAMKEREPDPNSIRYSSDAPAGVAGPATYASYSDETLRNTANNGDATAAALYGARLVARASHPLDKPDPDTALRLLGDGEARLAIGLRARIVGAHTFFVRAAQTRAGLTHQISTADPIAAFPDRSAVIEVQARNAIAEIHGSMDERGVAHFNSLMPGWLPPLRDRAEAELVLKRVRELEAELALDPPPVISSEERRMENAVIAFFTKSMAVERQLDALHCTDGRRALDALSPASKKALGKRYGISQ